MAFIIITLTPNIKSVARFLIEQVVPSIRLAVWSIRFFPNAKSISESLLKVSFVVAGILPEIFTIAIWKTIHIKT